MADWDPDPVSGNPERNAGTFLLDLMGSSDDTAVAGMHVRPDSLSDGPHEGSIRVAYAVTEPPEGETVIASGDCDLPVDFTLLPADRPSVTFIRDDSLADGIRQSLQVSLEDSGHRRLHPFPGHLVSFGDLVSPLPIGVGFDVYLRANGREVRVGAISGPKGAAITPLIDIGNRPFPDDHFVDVILRCSPAAAANRIDVTQVWEGDLTFGKVPVERDDEWAAVHPRRSRER